MANKTTNKNLTNIKRPVLILNDATKFYLATHEVSTPGSLYFIISLFAPVKNNSVVVTAIQTEITAFDDAKSASVYYETLQNYCAFNEKSAIGKTFQESVNNFNRQIDEMIENEFEMTR